MKKQITHEFLYRIILILIIVLFSSCAQRTDKREQANKLYNQGLELAYKVGVFNLLDAAALFKKSFETDTTFANSYAFYAITFALLGGSYNYLPPEKVWAEIKPALNKAEALDPNLAWVYLAKAYVEQYFTWNWTEMGKNLKKAAELEPENVTMLVQYANYLVMMNRADEAKMFEDKAIKLAPDSPELKYYLHNKMIIAGEFEKAKQSIQKEIEANPQDPYTYADMATLCSCEGSHEEALKALNVQIPLMNGDINDEVALMGFNYARLGKTEEALAQLSRLDSLAQKGIYVPPVLKAWIYSGLNNRDEAIAYLEKGYNEHAFRMGLDISYYFSFLFKPIADDPRYKELLKKMNL